LKATTLEEVLAARARRAAVARVLWLKDGRERLVSSAEEIESDPAIANAVRAALASDVGRLIENAGGDSVFVQPFVPAIRVAIVGAVHIAQHLAVLAKVLGHEVLVIDPRRGFLTEARFPGVVRSHEWPDAALAEFALDTRSALVTLSHDPKIDDPALEAALTSSCFYVGALGSQRTQAKRRDRLRDAGFDEEAIARVRGPVGLDIGARSPAEIALSIAAELTACVRSGA
jgi:xanthine dehydrogenase accessory factor